MTAPAKAAAIYVDAPGLLGNDPVPGFPDAFSAASLTVDAGGFSITRAIDPLSVALEQAVVLGTVFPSATIGLYNAAPLGPADATLTFPSFVVASRQLSPMTTEETDSFVAGVPKLLYLDLPGIVGSASAPGLTGLIPIQSFTLAGDRLTISKSLDSTTPALFNAAILSEHFADAEIVTYDTSVPSAVPAMTLLFDDVSAVSQQISGIVTPLEADGFAFSTVSQPTIVPSEVAEPSSLLLLFGGASLMAVPLRLKRRHCHLTRCEVG